MTREEIKEVMGIINYMNDIIDCMNDNCENSISMEDLINDDKSSDEIPKFKFRDKYKAYASKVVNKALDKYPTTRISELFDDDDSYIDYTFDDIFGANDRDCIMQLTDERYRPRSEYARFANKYSRGKCHRKYYTVKDHGKRPRSMLTKNQLEMLDIMERATGKKYFV